MPAFGEKDRPAAWGHRFGPDLSCSECGITWEEHQAEPGPCEKRSHDPGIDQPPTDPVDEGDLTPVA